MMQSSNFAEHFGNTSLFFTLSQVLQVQQMLCSLPLMHWCSSSSLQMLRCASQQILELGSGAWAHSQEHQPLFTIQNASCCKACTCSYAVRTEWSWRARACTSRGTTCAVLFTVPEYMSCFCEASHAPYLAALPLPVL